MLVLIFIMAVGILWSAGKSQAGLQVQARTVLTVSERDLRGIGDAFKVGLSCDHWMGNDRDPDAVDRLFTT